MIREMKRVWVVVLAMFVVLFISTSIIQGFQVDALAADSRNTRSMYDSFRAKRGPILAGGTAVADSQPIDDDYKFQRVYGNPLVYAPVTGYFTLNQGMTGLEGAMNNYLSGRSGSQFLDWWNSVLTGKEPTGASVETTIDPTVQQVAWDALGDYTGAVIVTEVATGKIIAMVSKPSYDPNALASHDIDAVLETYDALLADPAEPLINRAIDGDLNPPGSTFKLVVAAAALESGKYTPESEFPNPASYTLPQSDNVVKNASRTTCGSGDTVTLATALRLSCNIPFAELAVELGYKAIVDQSKKFGFNQSFDIPMTTAQSTIPQVMNEPQTALAGFGQFDVRATPLQIALVSAAIANGGKEMYPNLVASVTSADLKQIVGFTPKEFGQPISAQTAEQLTQMMVASVSSGAGSNAKIDNVSVAGKTGTAENGDTDPYTLWFTGFAPADSDPKYAITVLVEDGGGKGQRGTGNTIAAPIAKTVLEAVLNK